MILPGESGDAAEATGSGDAALLGANRHEMVPRS